MHEAIEAYIAIHAGVSPEAVDKFDKAYEAHRKRGDDSEPPFLQASSTWQAPALIPEPETTSTAVALQRHAEMVRPDLQAELL
jgi:hypothetical protein